ncbi:MAG: dihydroneopterin aldolase [Abditibacteriota bacterium]|nr:dihydroneopterin aldolase [Abditibacteriota bacterium]
MDIIAVDRIAVDAIIGTNPEERTAKQRIYVSLRLGVDISKAAASDDLKDAVDYFTLTEKVYDFVSESRFQLIEALSSSVADLCIAAEGVKSVEVTVEKPDALAKAENVRIIVSKQK